MINGCQYFYEVHGTGTETIVLAHGLLLSGRAWHNQLLALRDRYRFKPDHVFLMPEGTDSATLREREQWLAPLCVEHGFRMSDRLHIHLFGDTRGT